MRFALSFFYLGGVPALMLAWRVEKTFLYFGSCIFPMGAVPVLRTMRMGLSLTFGEYGLLDKNEREQSLQKLDPREIESQELTHKKASGTMWTSKRV